MAQPFSVLAEALQDRYVLDALLEEGRRHGMGLEVGSKPELLAVMTLRTSDEPLVICNGYKDDEYIEMALYARKAVANTIIDFVDEDLAHVESHVCARHLRDDGDDVLAMETFFGRYVDRFERRAGEWKIAERVVVHDWDLAEPVTLAFPPGRFTEGARGPTDRSYHGRRAGPEA